MSEPGPTVGHSGHREHLPVPPMKRYIEPEPEPQPNKGELLRKNLGRASATIIGIWHDIIDPHTNTVPKD